MLATLLYHILRPDTCLYLTKVGFMKKNKAQTALPYSTTDTQWKFVCKQLLVKIKFFSVLFACYLKLT